MNIQCYSASVGHVFFFTFFLSFLFCLQISKPERDHTQITCVSLEKVTEIQKPSPALMLLFRTLGRGYCDGKINPWGR